MEPNGRAFELVICAQAWWWLDREAALANIEQALPLGGRLGIFWNAGGSEDEVTLALSDAYRRVAETVREPMLPGGFSPRVRDELEADERFAAVETASYEWERRYTRDEWLDAAATFGDVLALQPEPRTELLSAIAETIDAHGGVRDVKIVTSLVTAVRTSKPQ